jgi:hypothetical protein
MRSAEMPCGGEVHGIEPRGAEAVDLHARRFAAESGLEHRGARNVAAGLAHGIDAAQDHVLDDNGVEAVATAKGVERRDRKVYGRDLVQGSVRLAAPTGSAHGIVDEGLRHAVS